MERWIANGGEKCFGESIHRERGVRIHDTLKARPAHRQMRRGHCELCVLRFGFLHSPCQALACSLSKIYHLLTCNPEHQGDARIIQGKIVPERRELFIRELKHLRNLLLRSNTQMRDKKDCACAMRVS